jgi:glycosyltransferase involved in cell wall biosynthesis
MTSPAKPAAVALQSLPSGSSNDEPTISVIIPVYNGGQHFRKCLVSVKALVPSPVEVIVVGDGDTDGSSQFAEEQMGITVIRFPSPGGPARARNFGASRAKGEIVYFVDADVIVPSDAIGRVAMVFNQEPDLAALFGSYDDHPGETTFLSQYRNLLHHYVHQQGCEDASTFWGACGAIRRDVFLSVGGFDEGYVRPSVEDIELGYRLRKAGHRIRLCKSLQVKHLKRWDVASMLRADLFQRALPWTEIILRERNCINDLNTGLSGRASVALTFVLLGALLLALRYPPMLAAVGATALSLLILNAPLYGFFLRKRGLIFVLHVIPWHWFYFFYSGVGFLIGLVRHLFGRNVSRMSQLTTASHARPRPAPRSELRK